MSQNNGNKRAFFLNETAVFKKSKWTYSAKDLYLRKESLTEDEIKKQVERALNRNADAIRIMNTINDLSWSGFQSCRMTKR